MSFKEVFYVNSEEKQKIEKFYEQTEDDLNLLRINLRKWIESQPHLPNNQDDYYIEMMLKLNKFNVEKTKSKIEMYYSMRHIVPEFYQNRSVFSDEMKNFMSALIIMPLPRLSANLERLYLIKFIDTDPSKFEMITISRYMLSIFELRMRHDPAIAERYIIDLKGLRFGHVLKSSPKSVKRIYTVMEKAYSDKIKGVHFLNMPLMGHTLVTILKLVLNEKLANRVYSHKDFQSMTDFFSSEILPSDYNGTQKSSDELYENWKKCLEESDSWLEEVAKEQSNEDLRVNNEEDNKTSYFQSLFQFFRN